MTHIVTVVTEVLTAVFVCNKPFILKVLYTQRLVTEVFARFLVCNNWFILKFQTRID